MAFVPFTDGNMEAILRFNVAGIAAIMTMGVRKVDLSPTSPTDGAAVVNILDTWFTTYCQADLASTTEITGETVNDLTSATGWTFSGGDPHTGNATGTQVPNQLAMCITLLTGSRGRSYRGRNYVPGLADPALLSPTQWTTTATNAWTANYEGLLTLFGSSDYELVILSRFLNGSPRSVGIATTVVDVHANQGITTQRRRLT